MFLLNHINQAAKHFLKEVSQFIYQNQTRRINHLNVSGVDSPYLYLITYNREHQVEIIVSVQVIDLQTTKVAITVNQQTNMWETPPYKLDAEDLAKTILAYL